MRILMLFYRNEQILTHVPTEDVFNLFLLETTFDDESSSTVNTSRSTHFGKEVLDDVLGLKRKRKGNRSEPRLWSSHKRLAHLTMHLFANIGDVGENGFLVSFSEELWWSNGVSFFGSAGKK